MNISTSIENKIYFSKYKPDSKIGQGSFGKIYSAHNINNGDLFALKLEKRSGSNSLLEIETYILCYLKGEGIPFIKSFGFSGEYNVLVMELLGKSLETLFKENDNKFSLKTVCMLAEQMISRLEYIHKKYILHRDIKPDNFTIGRGKKSHIIYLIDFGLAKKYKSSKGNHEHIKYSENKKLIGTARYASINALKGCEQGRRDDMESLGYVLMYFLRGNLPWQGLKLLKGDDRNKKIYEVKKDTSAEELCAGYPKQFCEYIRYTRNLKFEQEPNYDYLKRLIYSVMNRYEYNFDFLFDWGIKKNRAKFNKNNSDENGIIKNKDFEIINNINRINNTAKKENIKNEQNNNNRINANKKLSLSNINNINLNKKNTFRYSDYKSNKNHKEINIKKKQYNKNKCTMTEKGKNQNMNRIKNNKNINKLRNSQKTTKSKKIFKNNDNNIFDKLLNSNTYTQDIFNINKSQDMNLRISNYKFLSELNSSHKKINEKDKLNLRTKNLTPINYNNITTEETKENGCFIF